MENGFYEIDNENSDSLLLDIRRNEKMIRLLKNRLIKKYDVFSFDIFDTLIERKVTIPSQIFYMAGSAVLGNSAAKEFCSNRMEAEKMARNFGGNNECTLEEIYKQLNGKYGSMCDALMKAEVEAELNNCMPRKKLVEFYNECIERGKRVFIISDMYLPGAVIKEMLRKCGVIDWNGLYISNEHNKNKRNSELFQSVIEDNCIERNSIIHIGDSFKADFWGARKAGIDSLIVIKKHFIRRLCS